MMDVSLDPYQQRAFEEVVAWHKAKRKQEFSIGGLAGVGKTTLIRFFIEHFRNVVVCAYTGKAVHVLLQKGVDAVTLHRLLYEYVAKDEDGQPLFEPKPVGALDGLDLVIVDEASMVSRQLAQELLKHGIPVLWVGDHGQLEPVGSGSISLVKDPDVRLEHIHRQALQSGIISFAHHLRCEQNPYTWNFEYPKDVPPDVQLFQPQDVDVDKLLKLGFDVLIVGTNERRIYYNKAIRQRSGYDEDQEPQPGEPLLILRNNYRYGIFNGQVVTVEQIVDRSVDLLWIEFRTDDGDQRIAPFLKTQFHDAALQQQAQFQFVLANFGYALTAHKFQGSESGCVTVLEEKIFSDARWRYTAATRAATSLYYVPSDRDWTAAKDDKSLIGKMARRPKKKLPKREVKKADPKKAAALRERMAKRKAKRLG